MAKTGNDRIVHLEDQGQDFTEFIVDSRGVILEARPFQSWIWSGYRIAQRKIRVGMKPKLVKDDGKPPIELRYPVVAVEWRTS